MMDRELACHTAYTPVGNADDKIRLFRSFRFVALILAIVWIVFFAIDRAFPYLQSGSDLIYAKKYELIERVPIFPPTATFKIAAFGNSKTLSGVIPSLFDQELARNSYTFNFGLPNVYEFVNELEKLVAKGDIPTHILLQVPWDDSRQKTFLEKLDDDKTILNTLVPFRHLPRDIALFIFFSRHYGGFTTYYAAKQAIVEQMVLDRGYHFIVGQSHYRNNRLPDDFALPLDKPNVVARRNLPMDAPLFHRLDKLVTKYGMHVYLVPEYYRKGELAPVQEPNAENVAKLAKHKQYSVVGPDYILLENHYFSDPVHLNPEGAVVYTRFLVHELGKQLTSSPRNS